MSDLTNKIFHDEDAARAYFEEERWPNGVICPFCNQKAGVRKLGGASLGPGWYFCNQCDQKKFTVRTGSIMERSHIPLAKWAMGFRLMASSKKGVSAKQIERMLGIQYKSAWFMMHRIREAMAPAPVKDTGPLGGAGKVVQSDETFVGGKKKNVHKGKPEPKKRPVLALVENGGQMRAKHIPNVTSKTVKEVLRTNVSRKSELHTDDSLVYHWLGREFAKHRSVNHSQDEYVGPDGETVNTAEAFFALLKRGLMGSFHSVSEQHLQRYVDEFVFRWNTRQALEINDTQRAAFMVKAGVGKRLTYRRLDQTEDAQTEG